MNQETLHQNVVAFLNDHKLGVISTVGLDNDQTESALVAFCNDDELNLIIGTSNSSRKYKNLMSNAKISFVIGWDPQKGTVQYEGVAQEIAPADVETYAMKMIERSEGSRKFYGLEDQRYFLIKPTWIRFTDNVQEDVSEISF